VENSETVSKPLCFWILTFGLPMDISLWKSPIMCAFMLDHMFFTAFDGTSGRGLWMSNGTESGTIELGRFECVGSNSSDCLGPRFMCILNDVMLFSGAGFNGWFPACLAHIITFLVYFDLNLVNCYVGVFFLCDWCIFWTLNFKLVYCVTQELLRTSNTSDCINIICHCLSLFFENIQYYY